VSKPKSSSPKVKITFSVTHVTRDGKSHKPDTTAALEPLEARSIVHIGHGRYADAATPAEADPADNEQE
jgi:hypothetical protein